MNYFDDLIREMTRLFMCKYGRNEYPNQDEVSCRGIYDKACLDLKKPLSILTTIDKDHDHWLKETKTGLIPFFKKYGVDINAINEIVSDFAVLDPNKFIFKGKKGFIFYDIHDIPEKSFMNIFLNSWTQNFSGTLALHDMSVSDISTYVCLGDHFITTHFEGKSFSGFQEVLPFIDYLNKNKIAIHDIPRTSVAYILR